MQNQNIVIKIVVFGIHDNKLMVLLESNHLIKDTLTEHTSLDLLARNIFSTVTQLPIHEYYIEQLYTLQQEDHNQVAIVYYFLVPETIISLPQNLQWQNALTIPEEIPDFSIIQYAIQRLRWKIEYTNVIYSLLPDLFTLSQLQEVYEAILGKKLDKRNFRKKILSLGFLTSTGKKRTGGARPAEIYTFKKREPVIVKVFS